MACPLTTEGDSLPSRGKGGGMGVNHQFSPPRRKQPPTSSTCHTTFRRCCNSNLSPPWDEAIPSTLGRLWMLLAQVVTIVAAGEIFAGLSATWPRAAGPRWSTCRRALICWPARRARTSNCPKGLKYEAFGALAAGTLYA